MKVRFSPVLLTALLLTSGTHAITFQTPAEKVKWMVEGDQFECRLSQAINNFGVGEFVRRAGEQPFFRLKSRERWLNGGSATLVAAAVPWRPGIGDINLGAVKVIPGEVRLISSKQQAGRLIIGLLEGRSPMVRHRALNGNGPMEIRVMPVRFGEAYQQYEQCTAKLLPVNFNQIRQVSVGFPGGGQDLDENARAKLDIILTYLKADPAVNRIRLTGYSDSSGSRLADRDVSRRRAVAVQDYLIAHGVPAEQITLRFFGEQYPLAPNNSPVNRAKNRRVGMELSKESVEQGPMTVHDDTAVLPSSSSDQAEKPDDKAGHNGSVPPASPAPVAPAGNPAGVPASGQPAITPAPNSAPGAAPQKGNGSPPPTV